MTANLHLSDFGLTDDPARPVLSALRRSLVDNVGKCSSLFSQLHARAGQPVDDSEIKQMAADALSHMKNFAELCRWVYVPRRLPAEEALTKARECRELGDEYVLDMAARLQNLPQGAPPKRRQAYLAAFEFMLQSKKNSMGRAVRKFCPCGKGRSEHEPKCSQRLKAGIHNIKKLLRKYAPDLATRYDALHPDRAKGAIG